MQKTPYNYRVSTEAELDIYESYLWYEKQQSGLGEEFLETLMLLNNQLLKIPKCIGLGIKVESEVIYGVVFLT